MSFTVLITKIIALILIYLGYKRCFVWIDKSEGSVTYITRWSSGLSLLLLGLVFLLFVKDIFNLPPG
jgi:hypothetical protein